MAKGNDIDLEAISMKNENVRKSELTREKQRLLWEVEDDQFDAEEVIRILKRLDELEPLPEPDMSAEESLEAFWEYVKEREREEKL